MVNRIWQHLFGQGLVRTPENFGAQGESPTHPELLEWLTADFMTDVSVADQAAHPRTHALGRLPTVFDRRASCQLAIQRLSQCRPRPQTPAKLDPDNKLLWRMPTKRLEAEVIRDCILATSGRLDSVMGGPPILLVARPDGLVVVDESKLKRPGRRQQAERLPALAAGLQPVAAHGLRPPAVCRQLSQARRLGDSAAVADDAQRRVRGRRGRPLRRPRRRRTRRRRATRSAAPFDRAAGAQATKTTAARPTSTASGRLQNRAPLTAKPAARPHRTVPHAPQHERVPVRRVRNEIKSCTTKTPRRHGKRRKLLTGGNGRQR